MALILNEENNRYQKIIIHETWINIDGVYATTVVFKNKSEREKEKLRTSEMDIFYKNVVDLRKHVATLSPDDLDYELLCRERNDVGFIIDRFEHIAYDYEILDKDDEQYTIPEELVVTAEKYGFKREWMDDAVVFARKDKIHIGEYKQQAFDLAEFYPMLKETMYTDADGNVSAIDDI